MTIVQKRSGKFFRNLAVTGREAVKRARRPKGAQQEPAGRRPAKDRLDAGRSPAGGGASRRRRSQQQQVGGGEERDREDKGFVSSGTHTACPLLQ